MENLPASDVLQGSSYQNFHGFWYHEVPLRGVLAVREHFNNPRPTDIILASYPKSGTTWLKALTFATVNRYNHRPSDPNHPLLFTHPHDCIQSLEEILVGPMGPTDLETRPSPRIFSVHMPFQLFPDCIKNSDRCKFIYVCRDHKDTVVSMWYFYRSMISTGYELEIPSQVGELFEILCSGVVPYGPICDHWFGYWNESLARPSKVLFLKYEDMKKDGGVNAVKRLAEFVGCAFSEEEEEEAGIVEEIVKLCSFDKLRGLEVSKTGDRHVAEVVIVKKSSYYSKGEVGDWENHLTSEMAERLDGIVEEKLRGSGLSFRNAD